eukprot:10084682-Ditylum_brightwellii.AAC.1
MAVARRVTQELSDNSFDILQVEDINKLQFSSSSSITQNFTHLTKLVQLTWVIDSTANDHMCNEEKYFMDLKERKGKEYVTLGDGTTTLPIKGIETVHIKVNQYAIKLINILYIPGL